MPSRLLGDVQTLTAELRDRGAYIEDTRLTAKYINQTNPKDGQTVATHRGWQDGDKWQFVQGDHGDLVYAPDFAMPSYFGARGSLEEWRQRVAKPCSGNARLVFFLSAAFAPALLKPLSGTFGNGVTFQIEGQGTTGKTTALRIAASVTAGGGTESGIRNWNATQVGLECIAAEYCDYMLPLDEISSADSSTIIRVVFQMAQGQGKIRGARDGGVRPTPTWRTIVLSTGNISLTAKANEKFTRAMGEEGGTGVRWIPILADAGAGMGMVEDPHGGTAKELMDALNDATSRYYGTAYPAWIDVIEKELHTDPDKFLGVIRSEMRLFVDSLDLGENPDGQVLRVADRFALVAVAGVMACRYGILPWDEAEVKRAAKVCFESWFSTRISKYGVSAELQKAMDKVRQWFSLNQFCNFVHVHEGGIAVPDERCKSMCGYRVTTNDGDTYWLISEGALEAVLMGASKDTYRGLFNKLVEIGWLAEGPVRSSQGYLRAPRYDRPDMPKKSYRAYKFTEKVIDVETKPAESKAYE